MKNKSVPVFIRCAGREELGPRQAAKVATATHEGRVILFPTDTLYGLGVDPLSVPGLDALFRLKRRDPGKPVLVLIADASLVDRFAAAVPEPWRALIGRFWPGPLTLLFPALPGLPPAIRSPAGKIALRVPGSALCRSVLRAAGGSLTGTSANLSGSPGTGDAQNALRQLPRGVGLFLDAGELLPSAASTLLDWDPEGGARTLRAGAVPADLVRRALGERPRKRRALAG